MKEFFLLFNLNELEGFSLLVLFPICIGSLIAALNIDALSTPIIDLSLQNKDKIIKNQGWQAGINVAMAVILFEIIICFVIIYIVAIISIIIIIIVLFLLLMRR